MASTILTRTVASTGNNKILTWSGWVKRSDNSTGQLIAANGNPSDANYIIFFEFTGGGLRFIIKSLNIIANVETNTLFQDLSAWYHLVFTMDTTQATASDRVKMYVNGEQITDFALATYPSQNLGTQFNNAASVISVGGKYVSGANTDFFNGSMSHVHFIDGTAYAPTAFGETDTTTGQWKIKTSPSVTYGTNGFFILKDGNSVTDQSGNSNNLTVAGGTLTKTEDNPSNVFATLNPLATSSLMALSNGNLTATNSSASNSANSFSTFVPTKGKYYVEYKVTATGGTSPMLGIKQEYPDGFRLKDGNEGAAGYSTAYEASIRTDGQRYQNNGTASWGGTSFTTGDIISIALDCDNGAGYIAKNGTYMYSGNPTSGASKTGAFVVWTQAQVNNFGQSFAVNNFNGGAVQANFGNGFFGTTAVASAGTNASGNGIFEYDVPTGYTALSTKGLNL